MSGYKNFAVVGAGSTGSFIIRQLLKEKATGIVNNVVVLTREGSKTTVDGDVKLIPVDYSNKESIKNALIGVDVVISTIATGVLHLQVGLAEAAKEAGVKLFVPSEFGGKTEGATEGFYSAKANIQTHLKGLSLPYTLFYTGGFADLLWTPALGLDVTSGKVTVGGDGNTKNPFTSRVDIARYVSYILTRLPAEQLNNRSFTMAGDTKSFNEIFKEYEAKTGKKLEVTYIPVSELDARLATNPEDIYTFLRKVFTIGPDPKKENDNYLYPYWNPSPLIDNLPVV
ncbi:NAD-P-binding protein [Multifurca ochricompacta]|uniref:NAD-P-binding protein n=1 Tax=Multifurca ochricompacta TaxID=376703 RepID=A0AAD4M493_9AGAM|nr:NAD-P-binding protein [Multifurca ochricompacta]